MTKALRKAVGALYKSFACQKRPSSIPWCTCKICSEGQNISVLLSKPLRLLTPDDLTFYAESVFLTVGSQTDFKYFLPRILEVLASECDWWPSPEVVGSRINDCGWNDFSIGQQNAIKAFFREVLISLIEARNGRAIDQWICGTAACVPVIQPYLSLLEKDPLALITFYEQNSYSLAKGKLSNSFWKGQSGNKKLILGWFQSNRVKTLIDAPNG